MKLSHSACAVVLVGLTLAACGGDSLARKATVTPSATGTATASTTPTFTSTRTATATSLPTETATVTATITATHTAVPTATATSTVTATATSALRIGVAAVSLKPCGDNPDYHGPITASGVWGEQFTDSDGNGRWDVGEPFVDDPGNTALDAQSAGKYDGIFLAGFGNDRIATGCHDDLWARVVVLQGPTTKVALVSVDFVGVINHGRYAGFAHARELVSASAGLDAIVFSSTHDHEAPDTLGLWGVDEVTDGKFPLYLEFVDRQIARAIDEAAAPEHLRTVRTIAATTDPSLSPGLRGLQVRTRCRPPFFFDQELRALRFVDDAGATVATVINWNTHPESLEDENTLVSSDFIHYIRARVERDLGGTAVYFTGDIGAAEIVGDTCVGGADAHAGDGSNEFDQRDELGFARTERIGNLVGDAAVSALAGGEPLEVGDVDVARTDYRVAGSNIAFSLGATVGVLDIDMAAFDPAQCPPGTAFCAPVEQHLVRLLDAANEPLVEIVTAPGELFPELFYGTADHHRVDCPAAATGLPYEPSIRDAMRAPYRFLIGLSPDELGYIVPGYDFRAAPGIFQEADDPCQGQGFDAAHPRRTVPSHYHESLSIGADIAATSTCHALLLLGREDDAAATAACQRVLP